MKDSRLGDKMPNRRDVKWGSMVAGESHLSDEFHVLDAGSSPQNKWGDMEPSKGHMSDKWVEQTTSTSWGDQFHEMKQEGRQDPYSMSPSSGDRSQGFKKQSSVKPDNKVSRATQHTEFGSTREL